jgi:hypothetical protein
MEVKYANIVRFRLTRAEVAIEFGSFFPPGEEDNRMKPDHRDFHTRIVLPPEIIEAMKQSLTQVSAARDQAQRTMQGQPNFSIDIAEVKSA